jgi:hypothetical protein
MENDLRKEDEIYDIEKDFKFCSQKENKINNKKESKEQILNFNYKSFKFYTYSYSKFHGKIKVNLTTQQKKELVDKYWIIKPLQKYDFYSKAIKNIWKNEEIAKLQHLIGIIMVFNNFLKKNELERFDNYFSILIKSNERSYCKQYENGKLLYIGGDLKEEIKLGDMLKKEFANEECNTKDNSLPVYISIMVYDEYEKIESDALDLCDKEPEHNGFSNHKEIFHQSFPKELTNKVRRIKNEKRTKKEKLRAEDNPEKAEN